MNSQRTLKYVIMSNECRCQIYGIAALMETFHGIYEYNVENPVKTLAENYLNIFLLPFFFSCNVTHQKKLCIELK